MYFHSSKTNNSEKLYPHLFRACFSCSFVRWVLESALYTEKLLPSKEVGWGPVGHAVVTKLLAKSGGALKITVISEAGPSVLGGITAAWLKLEKVPK